MSDVRNNLFKMEKNLKKIMINVKKTVWTAVKKLLRKFVKVDRSQSALNAESGFINIAALNAVDFYFNLKRRKNEIFSTSLYEIDRILKDRQKPLILTDEKLTTVHET